MSKVMIIGDAHFSPRIPISRKDDYPETLLRKLDSIYESATVNNVSDLIFLGDLFNTKHMTLSYFIKVFQKLKIMDDKGLVLHLIVGNHDITYNNESTLEDSPIQILFDSYTFDSRKSFILDNTAFYLYNYTELTPELPKPMDKSMYNVLVGHYFYDLGFGDVEHTLSKEQCSQLGYNAYLLGHDHAPYSPIKTKDYEVHRPGSLSRGTSQTCHINRDNIQVIIMDTKSHTFDYVDLPNILPASEVYKEDHLIDKVTLSTISESLQDLLSDLTFDNSSDIFATLNQIPMDDKIRELIISYLNNEGVYDKEGI